MEWIEVDPLPAVCIKCKEEDCYNCDWAGVRWVLSRTDELTLRRKAILKTIERLEKELASVDKELQQCFAQKAE